MPRAIPEPKNFLQNSSASPVKFEVKIPTQCLKFLRRSRFWPLSSSKFGIQTVTTAHSSKTIDLTRVQGNHQKSLEFERSSISINQSTNFSRRKNVIGNKK